MSTNVNTISKQDAVKILGSRLVLAEPGKFRVKVTTCGDFHNITEGGTVQVAIANFGAMTPYQIEQAKADIMAGKTNEALNHGLSLSIRDKDYRPAKGEEVDITLGWVETKSGEKALLVTGLTPVATKFITTKVDFSSFLDEVVETVDSTELEA
jgi:hypothetical protein